MSDRCTSCKAEVIFGLMESGRWMPFDAQPDPRGEWQLFGDTPRAVHVPAERRDGRQLHTSHFATCPHADEHRRAR